MRSHAYSNAVEGNQVSNDFVSVSTLRLIRGKPWPGAGGLAGRGPLGGLLFALEGEGEAFRLKGFSLQVR